jgi:dipeptidyl aminopeptidase/acylaminoacyl peptidase
MDDRLIREPFESEFVRLFEQYATDGVRGIDARGIAHAAAARRVRLGPRVGLALPFIASQTARRLALVGLVTLVVAAILAVALLGQAARHRLAYVTPDGVYLADADGRHPHRIAAATPPSGGIPVNIAWSSTGLYFAVERNDAITWILAPDGSKVGQITGAYATSWSPAEDILSAMVGNVIDIYRPDGGLLRRVRPSEIGAGEAHLGVVRWSPDGHELLVMGCVGSAGPHCEDLGAGFRNDLWIVDWRAGTARLLTDTPHNYETSAEWSTDGKTIAFSTSGCDVGACPIGTWLIDTDGTNPRQLSDEALLWLQWTPDGATVIGSRMDGSGWISLPLDGRISDQDWHLDGIAHSNDTFVGWSPDRFPLMEDEPGVLKGDALFLGGATDADFAPPCCP